MDPVSGHFRDGIAFFIEIIAKKFRQEYNMKYINFKNIVFVFINSYFKGDQSK